MSTRSQRPAEHTGSEQQRLRRSGLKSRVTLRVVHRADAASPRLSDRGEPSSITAQSCSLEQVYATCAPIFTIYSYHMSYGVRIPVSWFSVAMRACLMVSLEFLSTFLCSVVDPAPVVRMIVSYALSHHILPFPITPCHSPSHNTLSHHTRIFCGAGYRRMRP